MKRNKHREFSPFYACFLPRLKEAANKHGYALSFHGSMATDLDLLCVPWVDDVSTPEVLIEEMSKVLRIDTIPGDPEIKPHGRLAWCLPICDQAVFDISVMPVRKTVEQVMRVIIDEELMPAVCEDSGQAEWSTGEARKLAEAICDGEPLVSERAYKIIARVVKGTQPWHYGKEGHQVKKRVYVTRADFERYAPETAKRWGKSCGLKVEAYVRIEGAWQRCEVPEVANE